MGAVRRDVTERAAGRRSASKSGGCSPTGRAGQIAVSRVPSGRRRRRIHTSDGLVAGRGGGNAALRRRRFSLISTWFQTSMTTVQNTNAQMRWPSPMFTTLRRRCLHFRAGWDRAGGRLCGRVPERSRPSARPSPGARGLGRRSDSPQAAVFRLGMPIRSAVFEWDQKRWRSTCDWIIILIWRGSPPRG